MDDETSQDFEMKQFLHSGTIVRNSGDVVALVLYCGRETKIVLNQGSAHSKSTEVEKKLNYLLTGNLALLFILAGIFTAMANKFLREESAKLWYVYPDWEFL